MYGIIYISLEVAFIAKLQQGHTCYSSRARFLLDAPILILVIIFVVRQFCLLCDVGPEFWDYYEDFVYRFP
jgi:hypothetical protein